MTNYMIKKPVTILILLFLTTGLYAQLKVGDGEIGITLSGGISRIYYEDKPSFYRPSANIGIYHRIKLNKKTFVGSEFSVLQIEGKQEFSESIWDTHERFNNTYYYLSHSTYIGFSAMIGWDIYKVSIDIKGQFLYLALNKGEEVSKKRWDGNAVVDDNSKYNDFFDTKGALGLRVSLNYQITNHLIITGSSFYSLSTVHSYVGEQMNQMNGKTTQITLGVRYSLWTGN